MMKPVRVLHVLEATEGGTRRWIENVVFGLDPERVRCSCICSLRRDPSFGETLDGFRRLGLDVWTVDMKRNVDPFRDTIALLKVVRILRRYRVGVIHAHSSKAGMLTRVAARIAGCGPVVYTPHAYSFLAGGRLSRFYLLLEKLARSWTDWVVAVSQSERDRSIQVGYSKDRIRLIPNGVTPPSGVPRQKTSPPTIGMAASLRPQKDPLTFIEACHRLHSAHGELRFVLAGSGPMRRKVEERVRKRNLESSCTLTGRVSDARPLIGSWSVCVLCSRYEGMPYALLEAMAEGTPVVASRAPGVEELVENGETGLLVPCGSAGAFAEAVERLLKHPEDARRMAENARRRVSERYNLADQLERLTEFYESIV